MSLELALSLLWQRVYFNARGGGLVVSTPALACWCKCMPPKQERGYTTTSPRNGEVASGERHERPRNDICTHYLGPAGEPLEGESLYQPNHLLQGEIRNGKSKV